VAAKDVASALSRRRHHEYSGTQYPRAPVRRVLITGATGFIGFELARQLSDLGARPRLMVRRSGRAALLSGFDAEPVFADLHSDAGLRRAVAGIDTVFHLAARATFERYARLRPSIVDGSTRLMRAAIDAGVRRFVYTSSLFVHGSQSDPITAATPPRPQLDYGRAKWEAEQRLGEMADRAGVSFAAIRLPHTYGAQSLLFGQLHRGLVLFPGNLDGECAHLHVEDAARALIAIGKRGWSGTSPIGDLSGGTWRIFFDVVRAFYPRFRLIRIPRPVALTGARLVEPLHLLRSSPTLATVGTVVGFNLNLPVDATRLWSDLGLRPRYPSIAEGIPAVLDDYVRFRWRHPVMDRAA
jgi:dihydroflavonol-4-reductase